MTKVLEKAVKIVRDEMMGGAARLSGTRIRVIDIVEKYVLLGYSPEEIARAFRISLSDVHEALSYYYAHTEDIREDMKKHGKIVERFRKQLS